MTNRQEAKMNMYDAVISHCEAHSSFTNSIAAFETAFTLFKQKVAELKAAAQSQKIITSGVAIDKVKLKDTLAQMGAAISSAAYAYAEANQNIVLREKMTHNYSGLFKLRDEDLAQTCRNILAEANTAAAQLEPYGVTAPVLLLLQNTIDSFSQKVPAPRNAVSLRATHRVAIAALIKETDSILKNRMDKIALQFKGLHPVFYSSYKKNRVILDPLATATKIAGIVTKQGTDVFLAAVNVSIEGQEFVTATDALGSYSLKTPVPGICKVVFEKPGYVTKTKETVIVTLGKTTTLNVQLDPLT